MKYSNSTPSDPNEYIQRRRMHALTRIAQEATPAYIARVIALAGDGDEAALQALAWDFLTIDDLRELLQSREPVAAVLERFKWSGHWTGTAPRLFIVTPDLDSYLAFLKRHELDPYRVFHYPNPDEARDHLAINTAHGIETEVMVWGGLA